MFIEPRKAFDIEKAIIFLIEEYKKSGNNPKPVIFHSISVAMHLFFLGYKEDLIIPALLHDLIEDSSVTYKDIEISFGTSVATDVLNLSFKSDITDYVEQYKEMFNRVIEGGRNVILIKAVDIYANSFFIRLVEDRNKQKKLIDKIGYFIEINKMYESEKIFIDLKQKYLEEICRYEKTDN